MGKLTIGDIAAQAGVSKATVSRVLNDRVELASRQLQRSLRRHAMIEQKTDIAG